MEHEKLDLENIYQQNSLRTKYPNNINIDEELLYALIMRENWIIRHFKRETSLYVTSIHNTR